MAIRTLHDCRDAFADRLIELAQNDDRIVVLTNDSVSSSRLGAFVHQLPGRLINVGIAEQNMVGIAAGLANAGYVPVVCGASCFLLSRALEQIRVDIAYAGANVKVVGMSPGVAYGALGPTHHSTEDLAWMRSMPALTVVVPADRRETETLLEDAMRVEGPVYVRVSRTPVPDVHPLSMPLPFGETRVLREGRDVVIAAIGIMVARALEAADLLAVSGIQATVLNCSSIRPFDADTLVRHASHCGAVVTVEDHSIVGGLGSAVAEVLGRVPTSRGRISTLGIPDVFAPVGTAESLMAGFGLGAEGIARAALEAVG
jgi:transketolase